MVLTCNLLLSRYPQREIWWVNLPFYFVKHLLFTPSLYPDQRLPTTFVMIQTNRSMCLDWVDFWYRNQQSAGDAEMCWVGLPGARNEHRCVRLDSDVPIKCWLQSEAPMCSPVTLSYAMWSRWRWCSSMGHTCPKLRVVLHDFRKKRIFFNKRQTISAYIHLCFLIPYYASSEVFTIFLLACKYRFTWKNMLNSPYVNPVK